MSSFFSFLKTKKIPNRDDIVALTTPPLTLTKILMGVICLGIIILTLSLTLKISNHFSIEIPAYGGTLKEGVIGAPHLINPFLATTDTDKLLTSLVFSSLVGYDNTGAIFPILAETYSISPDGLTAQFKIRDHASFSDGTPITSSDVLFSFETYKNLENNIAGSTWNNLSIETPDERTVVFHTTQKTPDIILYALKPIAPRHIWEPIPRDSFKDSTNNMSPIGSGPYRLTRISYKNTIPQTVILKRNKKFPLKNTYIDEIDVSIFANQLSVKEALVNGDITSSAVLDPSFIDESIKKDLVVETIPLQTTVSLFQNTTLSEQTKKILETISPFIDRNDIIDTIENGYGIPLADTTTTSDSVYSGLERLGYKKDINGTLSKQGVPVNISIALRKDDSLLQTATVLADQLGKLGITTEVKVFDQGVFIDELSRQSFSLLLEKTDITIPGYKTIIPLYRKTLLHTKIDSLATTESSVVQTKEQYWTSMPSWSLVTDTVWKWFTKR